MVKRYDQWHKYDAIEEMENGDFVKHDDYAALAERCERLEGALRGVMSDCRRGADKYGMSEYGIKDIIRRIEAVLAESNGGKA